MSEIVVKKIVDKSKVYRDEKGKDHCSVNYYLVINNTYVAIRPCFSKGYTQLDVVADVTING